VRRRTGEWVPKRGTACLRPSLFVWRSPDADDPALRVDGHNWGFVKLSILLDVTYSYVIGRDPQADDRARSSY
jgi:hypothetical protein